MKRWTSRILIGIITALCACAHASAAAAQSASPDQYFYQGNATYQTGDYANALLAYDKALDLGYESGNLYYNIGNAFFKANKLGYAILFYERAKRLIPGDSDLRSNLSYARSLTGEQPLDELTDSRLTAFLKRPFRNMTLMMVTRITWIAYIIMLALHALTLVNPVIGKKIRLIRAIADVLGIYTLIACCVRYDAEALQARGIVLQKNVPCMYEPIDKSTVYFKLPEGLEVKVVTEHDGWRQIRRADGKTGWVKKELVEPIEPRHGFF